MKKVEMKVVNPNAAGIDVGSKSHFVAVGQNDDQIREFGISHSSHLGIIDFLNVNGVKTIAMESTGSYWQNLFLVLAEAGFEVLLVPGTQTKSFRKTDVKDARHIQQLHALGLLNSCFLPDAFTTKVRELCRHRKSLVQDCSKCINRMQKCLRMMNLRLDVLVSDITGVSGRRIIQAVLEGERDPAKLASLAHARIKKSREEITDGLHGNYKEELMYELKDNFDLFMIYQQRIQKADSEIEKYYSEQFSHIDLPKDLKLAKKQLKGKNQPQFNIQTVAYKMYGVDISQINGVSVNTILSLISEVGTSIYKFPSHKAFVSWLRLSPNNRISGGKILSGRTPKGKNALAIAFRDAANVIGNQKAGYLTAFFKKIGLKKGRLTAITATARKLAVIIYNMIIKKEPYNPELSKHIQEKIEQKRIQYAIKTLQKNQFHVVDNQGVILS